MLRLLVVAASGGLGTAVVREALSRNHSVTVLVRSQEKLAAALNNDASLLNQLAAVHVGSGDDPEAVAKALRGCTDVVSCAPPNAGVAKTLGTAAKAAGARLVWTAGASMHRRHLRFISVCLCLWAGRILTVSLALPALHLFMQAGQTSWRRTA
jgi:uncharacterized protein YbjT (DUF2867 family)